MTVTEKQNSEKFSENDKFWRKVRKNQTFRKIRPPGFDVGLQIKV